MKTIIIVYFLVLVGFISQAQIMPEAFIGMLPNPPEGICAEGDNDGKKAFIEKVNEIQNQLQEEISRRNEKIENHLEANEDKMAQYAMNKTGVSPQLMQQMMAIEKASKGTSGETKKAYDAQKKALADQMMQQTANISMGEIENLKKMDKAGKAAWAEAYATEKKAEVMADPTAYQQKAAGMKKDLELVQKQQHLSDSLGARVVKFGKQIEEIDNSQDAVSMRTQIAELEAKLNEEYSKENRPNDDAIKSLISSIRKLQISYCNMQTPRYLGILADFKNFTVASIQPYYRLEKLTNQVNSKQSGVEIVTEPGLMGLQAVNSYLGSLADVYRYNNIRTPYIGGSE